jgi:hypothetical protein
MPITVFSVAKSCRGHVQNWHESLLLASVYCHIVDNDMLKDIKNILGMTNAGTTDSRTPPPAAPPSGRTGPTDRFGLAKLNPTKAGGIEWYSKFDNGHARKLASGIDPDDPWLDLSHGEGKYEINGSGRLTATGHYVRIYVVSPDHKREWNENLEITGVLTRIREFGPAKDSYIQVYCRTNHGIDYDEDKLLNDNRGYGAVFLYDGTWSFEKETAHHLDNGYAPAHNTDKFPLGNVFPKNTPVPFKYVIRNNAANTQTTVELWLGNKDSADGSPWTMVTSFTDTGNNWGVGHDSCSSGVDPAIRLTRSLVLPSCISKKPFLSVYLRNEEGTVAYEKLSIREVDPLP